MREEGAGEGEGGNHPKDILFFMRDKKSQTEIREVCVCVSVCMCV